MSHFQLDSEVRIGQSYNGGRGKSSGNQQGAHKTAGEKKIGSANSKDMNGQRQAAIDRDDNPKGPSKLDPKQRDVFNSHIQKIGWSRERVARESRIVKSEIDKLFTSGATLTEENKKKLTKIQTTLGVRLTGKKDGWGAVLPKGEKLIDIAEAEKAKKEEEDKATEGKKDMAKNEEEEKA